MTIISSHFSFHMLVHYLAPFVVVQFGSHSGGKTSTGKAKNTNPKLGETGMANLTRALKINNGSSTDKWRRDLESTVSKWPHDFVENYTLPPLQSSGTPIIHKVTRHINKLITINMNRVADPYQESGNKNDGCKAMLIALCQLASGVNPSQVTGILSDLVSLNHRSNGYYSRKTTLSEVVEPIEYPDKTQRLIDSGFLGGSPNSGREKGIKVHNYKLEFVIDVHI